MPRCQMATIESSPPTTSIGTLMVMLEASTSTVETGFTRATAMWVAEAHSTASVNAHCIFMGKPSPALSAE
jgi:hypothetical protein